MKTMNHLTSRQDPRPRERSEMMVKPAYGRNPYDHFPREIMDKAEELAKANNAVYLAGQACAGMDVYRAFWTENDARKMIHSEKGYFFWLLTQLEILVIVQTPEHKHSPSKAVQEIRKVYDSLNYEMTCISDENKIRIRKHLIKMVELCDDFRRDLEKS